LVPTIGTDNGYRKFTIYRPGGKQFSATYNF